MRTFRTTGVETSRSEARLRAFRTTAAETPSATRGTSGIRQAPQQLRGVEVLGGLLVGVDVRGERPARLAARRLRHWGRGFRERCMAARWLASRPCRRRPPRAPVLGGCPVRAFRQRRGHRRAGAADRLAAALQVVIGGQRLPVALWSAGPASLVALNLPVIWRDGDLVVVGVGLSLDVDRPVRDPVLASASTLSAARTLARQDSRDLVPAGAAGRRGRSGGLLCGDAEPDPDGPEVLPPAVETGAPTVGVGAGVDVGSPPSWVATAHDTAHQDDGGDATARPPVTTWSLARRA